MGRPTYGIELLGVFWEPSSASSLKDARPTNGSGVTNASLSQSARYSSCTHFLHVVDWRSSDACLSRPYVEYSYHTSAELGQPSLRMSEPCLCIKYSNNSHKLKGKYIIAAQGEWLSVSGILACVMGKRWILNFYLFYFLFSLQQSVQQVSRKQNRDIEYL